MKWKGCGRWPSWPISKYQPRSSTWIENVGRDSNGPPPRKEYRSVNSSDNLLCIFQSQILNYSLTFRPSLQDYFFPLSSCFVSHFHGWKSRFSELWFLAACFFAGFVLVLCLDSEDKCKQFLRNFGELLQARLHCITAFRFPSCPVDLSYIQ
jgi:hypothetical protein